MKKKNQKPQIEYILYIHNANVSIYELGQRTSPLKNTICS